MDDRVGCNAECDARRALLRALLDSGDLVAGLRCAADGLAAACGVRELWWCDAVRGRVLWAAPGAPAQGVESSELEPAEAAWLAAAREVDAPELIELGDPEPSEGGKGVLLALPVSRRGQRRATLCAVSRGPRAFDPAARTLLEDMGAHLAVLAFGAPAPAVAAGALDGALAAGVAHELRNPLVAMRHALRDVCAREVLPERDRELLGLAADEAERMDRILADLLDLAKARLHAAPADLAALAERTLALVRADPRAQHVQLACAAAPGLPSPRVDADRIQQVLWNLVLNAVSAAGAGGCVRLALASHAGGIELRVEDDGPGIPVERRERIFEPFETGRADGTGLGLPMARHLVALHGGSLDATDSPLGGACLRVWLPA